MAQNTSVLYKLYQPSLAPYWLQNGYGGKWLANVGSLKDEVRYRALSAVSQRLPNYAATDSLGTIMSERQLVRASGATDAQTAAKAADAFNRWYWGGTPYGLLRELSEITPGTLGVDFSMFIQTQQNGVVTQIVGDTGVPANDLLFYSTAGDTPNPVLALSAPPRWNTFLVGLDLVHTHIWHGAVPADSSSQANLTRTIIQRWRSQHSQCTKIVIQDPSASDTYTRCWGLYNFETGQLPAWGSSTWGSAPSGSSTTFWTPPSPQ